tara:strand:- start:52 stop:495 length:444 start_codon:yes stop_codon:yes gene_type:complete
MSGHFKHFQGERINTILPVATSATSTTYTLSPEQSGSFVFLSHSNLDDSCILNLPPPDFGLNFKFVIVNSTNSQNRVNIKSVNSSHSATALMYVSNTVDGSGTNSLVTNLEVEMNAIKIADSIEFICDGTYWYVNGNVGSTGEYTSS